MLFSVDFKQRLFAQRGGVLFVQHCAVAWSNVPLKRTIPEHRVSHIIGLPTQPS